MVLLKYCFINLCPIALLYSPALGQKRQRPSSHGLGGAPLGRGVQLALLLPRPSSVSPAASALPLASRYIGKTGRQIAEDLKLKSPWPCNCKTALSRGNPNHIRACELKKWRTAVQMHYTQSNPSAPFSPVLPQQGQKIQAIGNALSVGSGPWIYDTNTGIWVEDRGANKT